MGSFFPSPPCRPLLFRQVALTSNGPTHISSYLAPRETRGECPRLQGAPSSRGGGREVARFGGKMYTMWANGGQSQEKILLACS